MTVKNDSTLIKAVSREHLFHAEATAVYGDFYLPLAQKIEPQANAHLFPQGGYLSQNTGPFSVEGVLSYDKAFTQVAGNIGNVDQPARLKDIRITKTGKGWQTLSTVVIEGLNVLEILTADRIVGQILTEHQEDGSIPHVCFLGSRIENLQIAGYRVPIKLNPYILDKDHLNGTRRYATHGPAAELEKLHHSRHALFLGAAKGESDPQGKGFSLRNDLRKEYTDLRNRLETNNTLCASKSLDDLRDPKYKETVECSLVVKTLEEGATELASALPVLPDFVSHHRIFQQFGNLIAIRDFGVVELAKVRIEQKDFNDQGVPETTEVYLTMLDLRLGCAITGDVPVGSTMHNGK